MDVEPASTEFSISSFRAWTGATMISPAAILLTTFWSRAYEEGGKISWGIVRISRGVLEGGI